MAMQLHRKIDYARLNSGALNELAYFHAQIGDYHVSE